MSHIPVRQNESAQIERLEAARDLYACAKFWFGWSFLLAGPLSVALAFLGIYDPNFRGYIAAWGACAIFLDLFLFTPRQKAFRELAAGVQEQFDGYVLDLPPRKLKVGPPPDPEVVARHARAYRVYAARMTPVTDWYATCVASVPEPLGRIICQRSNCLWDAQQRRRFSGWVLFIVAIITVTIVVLGLRHIGPGSAFFLAVVAPLLPMLVLGIRLAIEQRQIADRLDKLKQHANGLWREALTGQPSPTRMRADARELQDEIFDNRKKSAIVFDFFFKFLRSSNEADMQHGAEVLVAEAQRALAGK